MSESLVSVVARFMVRQLDKLTVLSKVKGQANHPAFDPALGPDPAFGGRRKVQADA